MRELVTIRFGLRLIAWESDTKFFKPITTRSNAQPKQTLVMKILEF